MIQIWGVLLAFVFDKREREEGKGSPRSTSKKTTILIVVDECYPITKFLCHTSGIICTTSQEFFTNESSKSSLTECTNLILQTNWHIEKSKKYSFYDTVNNKIQAKKIWYWSDALRNASHFHEEHTIQFARERACLNKSPLNNPPQIKVIDQQKIHSFFASMASFNQLKQSEWDNLKAFEEIKRNDLMIFQRYFGWWKYSFKSDKSMTEFANYICEDHLELTTKNIDNIYLVEDARCIKKFTKCMQETLEKYAKVKLISLDSKLPSEYFILKANVPKDVYIYSYSGGAGLNLAINGFDKSKIIYKKLEESKKHFFKFGDGVKMINEDTNYYMETMQNL